MFSLFSKLFKLYLSTNLEIQCSPRQRDINIRKTKKNEIYNFCIIFIIHFLIKKNRIVNRKYFNLSLIGEVLYFRLVIRSVVHTRANCNWYFHYSNWVDLILFIFTCIPLINCKSDFFNIANIHHGCHSFTSSKFNPSPLTIKTKRFLEAPGPHSMATLWLMNELSASKWFLAAISML